MYNRGWYFVYNKEIGPTVGDLYSNELLSCTAGAADQAFDNYMYMSLNTQKWSGLITESLPMTK